MNKSTWIAFNDVQMNMVATIIFILIIAVKAMQPPAHSSTVDGDLVIVMTWPESPATDMDLWVKAPNDPKPVGFKRHFNGRGLEVGNDDTGTDDVHTTHRRFEKVVAKGLFPGEYVVNVHSYSKFTPCSVQLTAQLKDVQTGLVTTIWTVEASFDHLNDERTVARFLLDANGRYIADSFNTIPYPMIMQ